MALGLHQLGFKVLFIDFLNFYLSSGICGLFPSILIAPFLRLVHSMKHSAMKLRHYLEKSRNITLVTLPAININGKCIKGYSVPLVFYMYWN